MKLDSSIAAVVTGGASGLGGATVRALAAHGVKIAILDLERQREKGEALAKEVGGVFCPANVTSEEEVDAAFDAARAANGQERILVNCAGTGNAARTVSRDRNTGEVRRFATEAFNMIIQINLVGTFRCISKSAAGMLSLEPLPDGDRGAIVNTASVAAEDGQIGQADYTASKAGVVGLTLVGARDLSLQIDQRRLRYDLAQLIGVDHRDVIRDVLLLHDRRLAGDDRLLEVQDVVLERDLHIVLIGRNGMLDLLVPDAPNDERQRHRRTDIGSGSGVVGNAALFDRPDKSVVRGPFRSRPKPPWFATASGSYDVMRRFVAFEIHAVAAVALVGIEGSAAIGLNVGVAPVECRLRGQE